MSRRIFDPVNGVWVRVVPNIGLSVHEYDSEEDIIAIENILRSPEAQRIIAEIALAKVKAGL